MAAVAPPTSQFERYARGYSDEFEHRSNVAQTSNAPAACAPLSSSNPSPPMLLGRALRAPSPPILLRPRQLPPSKSSGTSQQAPQEAIHSEFLCWAEAEEQQCRYAGRIVDACALRAMSRSLKQSWPGSLEEVFGLVEASNLRRDMLQAVRRTLLQISGQGPRQAPAAQEYDGETTIVEPCGK